MNNIPILTITIPTFNRHDSLADLYKSFLKGVCSKFSGKIEVVVCDNSELEVAKKNRALFKDSGITYINNEINLGFSGNVIKCLKEASGSYLWIISDDDHVDLNAFEQFMETLPYFLTNKADCIMLPFINHDPFGNKYITNVSSGWKVKNPCLALELIESNDQFPFVSFSSAIINTEKYTKQQLRMVEDKFEGNDFIHIPLFLEVIRMDARVFFYEHTLQEYKTPNTIRFNISKLYSAMTDIIDYYLGSNELMRRRYCQRNYHLWLGWLLWDRTGLVNVPGAATYRVELSTKLLTCFSFNNFVLTLCMFLPKFILRWGYVLYLSVKASILSRDFSMIKFWEKIVALKRMNSVKEKE